MTVQRRTSSPHPSPAYSDEVAPDSARDDYPTEVFQPFRDDEPDEHGDYADPGHWQPNTAGEPESVSPVTGVAAAGDGHDDGYDDGHSGQVHADQGTARIDPEYPTQVIEAYRDEPEHDGSGYDNTGYDNTGYDNTAGYDNAGYQNTGYDNSGHESTGYDNAGHDGASYDNAGYAEPGPAQSGQGYSGQGYSDAQQGYQQAPEAGYATEVAHDGTAYTETAYDENGYEVAGHDGVSYDAGGYPEQGYQEQGHPNQGHAEQGYTEQGYQEQGHSDQGYTEQGYQEQTYSEQGHDGTGYEQGGYEQAGHEQGGYQEAGYAENGAHGHGDGAYADAGYADAGYADAEYADSDHSQPAAPATQADEPVPVAEQLFGSYHPGADEYVDTAIIPRITDHGTIVEDGDGEQPAAEHHANGQGAGTSGLPTSHPDYPTAEQPAAAFFDDDDDDPADEARPEAAAGPNGGGQQDRPGTTPNADNGSTNGSTSGSTSGPTDGADQNHRQDRDHGAEALAAAAPAAGLLAAGVAAAGVAVASGATGAATAMDTTHTGEPELLAGYSGDEGASAARPAALADDDGEGRTELIPRYTDERAGVAGKGRPAVLAMVLLVVAVVAAGVGFFSWTKAQQADREYPTGNIAFVNKVATAEVKDQVSKAIEAIYSYDSSQLDQSENRALSFITGSYTDEFKTNFATVRQLGPQEKASLVSTVVGAGVESLTESRATLLVMVNQVGHRGDNPQPLRAAVRLNVTAQKVDGQWKVSGVNQK